VLASESRYRQWFEYTNIKVFIYYQWCMHVEHWGHALWWPAAYNCVVRELAGNFRYSRIFHSPVRYLIDNLIFSKSIFRRSLPILCYTPCCVTALRCPPLIQWQYSIQLSLCCSVVCKCVWGDQLQIIWYRRL